MIALSNGLEPITSLAIMQFTTTGLILNSWYCMQKSKEGKVTNELLVEDMKLRMHPTKLTK